MNAIATRNDSTGFAVQPRNLEESMQFAQMVSKSQMVPKSYRNRPDDTLVAMMMGSELGLNPIQALQNIAVINGRPSIYGDALLALVQTHPAFGGHEEHFADNTMTATCTVWRKGDAQKHAVTFSQQDAVLAGLWGKDGPWKQYPKRMLMWRARGYALRDKFADALGGLITAEEARDIPTDGSPAPNVNHIPPAYPADQFGVHLPKWLSVIESGKRSAEDIIAMVETKGALTDEQKAMIRGGTGNSDDAVDAEFTESHEQEDAA